MNLWRALTEPRATLKNANERRHAQLTATVLALLVAIVVTGAMWYQVLVFVLPLMALCYGLSRTRYHQSAAIFALLLLSLPTYLALIQINTDGGNLYAAMQWLILPLILAQLLLPASGTAGLALLNVVGIITLKGAVLHNIDLGLYVEAMVFPVIVSVLAVVAQIVHHHYIVQHQLQEHKEMRRALELTNGQLEATNREIKDFAHMVVHDLRGPLVNITGYMQEVRRIAAITAPVLARGPDDPPDEVARKSAEEAFWIDLPEALDYIDIGSNKMEHLIEEMLKLSRAGQREIVREPLVMTPLITDTVKGMQHRIDQHRARVEVHTVPDVCADRAAMEHVFAKLLDNAIKYLQPGRPGMITVGGEHLVDETVYWVSDNGRGISEQDRDKVFRLFRRAGDPESVHGAGIGLTYVQTLVQRHGGRVWFESTPGTGSTFYLAIPDQTSITPQRRSQPFSKRTPS
jgi:signal transduction histidine kinase